MLWLLVLARLAALAAVVVHDDACLLQSYGKEADRLLAADTDADDQAVVHEELLSEQPESLIDAGTLLRQPVIDDGAVHLAAASCMSCERLHGMLKTLLAQARLEGGPRPVLHYFVDRFCVSHVLRFDRHSLESIDLRLYDASTIHSAILGNKQVGKPCTMVRLFVPRLFPKLRKLIFLDDDTLVLNSLRPIYELDVPAFAMAEDMSPELAMDPAQFCPRWKNGTLHLIETSRGHRTCFYGDYGTNAGVVLFNLEGWRQMGLDTQVDLWVDRLASGKWLTRYKDQAILNVLALEHPKAAALLPCEANGMFTARWMCFFHEGTWKAFGHVPHGKLLRRNSRRPRVLHDKFGDGTIAQHWRFLRQQAFHFADLVQAEGLRNASSLCDVFNCDRLIAEASWSCGCLRGVRKKNCDACGERPYFVESKDYPHAF